MIPLRIKPAPGPRPRPLALIRVRLYGGATTEPMKAVTFNGRDWEVISLHPVFRGAVLEKGDVIIEERL